jgi:hypothetical protein
MCLHVFEFLPIVPAVDEQNTWMRSSCTTAAGALETTAGPHDGTSHNGLEPWCASQTAQHQDRSRIFMFCMCATWMGIASPTVDPHLI